MIVRGDIAELWELRDSYKDVMVVKHDYKTRMTEKYLGAKNEDYPRKNWSSLVIFNCQHPANRILTPEFVEAKDGAFLHRFSWLKEEEIGELNVEWNYLAIEYEANPSAKIVHYTLGTPCFKEFKSSEMADIWWDTYQRANQGIDA